MSIEFDHTRAARNTKIWIIVGSLATMFFLGLEAWREHFAAEWRDHQRNYASLLPAEYQANFQVGLRQAFLPEIGRVDRCQSCHIGIEDPAMADQEQPLRSHSGDLLQTHPPEDFGCTICHQGQGRATWLPDGHGDISHWERPMLRGPLIYTSCGQCHVENTAFGELTEQFGGRVADAEIYEGDLSRNIPGARLLGRGKRLFVSLGCLGCHSYQGKGATRGRDLTHVGDKGVHGYDFSHLPAGAQRTPLAWLTEHFLDPGAISPGTVMPDMGVRRDEALALAAYMLSLRSQTVPSRFRAPSQVAKGRPASGRQLYDLFCVACHGRDLAGSYVPEIRTPSLSNEDFLSVASDDYLEAIIRHGRSGTNMPAWSADKAGLTDAQIQRIVAYIRSFAPDRADISSISSVRGDAAMGAAIYRGNCANCHGRKGEGGLGTALRSQGFLMMASDQMLARTIVEGRPNTGMPSWRNLSSQEVSDVLAHLRTWRGAGPDPAEIIAYVKSGAASQRIGKKIYRGNCADCHGRKGQGAVGPSLNSEAFLGIVNDEYLIHAICEGRPGTAMPAWTVLSVQDVGDLVVHLRSFAKVEYRKPVAPVTQGDPDNGSHLYAQACASCHGQQGSGGLGPQLANPVFLARATDGFLYQTIAHGRPGTPMLGFLRRGPGKQKGASGIVEYTATQIADLVAYLRSLRFRDIDPSLLRPVLGNAVIGKDIYEMTGSCAQCHGQFGEGAVGTALGNPAFRDQATEGFVIGTMVLGRAGTEMRKFSSGGMSKLTPQEMMDVAAYTRTLPAWRPEGTRGWRSFLAVGPLEQGRTLFTQFCASCHGNNGKDGYAPALNNPELLAAASDGFFIATIARGRNGTPMRAFGPGTTGLATLSADEIRSIVGYIRSWQKPARPTDTGSAGSAAGQKPDSKDNPNSSTQRKD